MSRISQIRAVCLFLLPVKIKSNLRELSDPPVALHSSGHHILFFSLGTSDFVYERVTSNHKEQTSCSHGDVWAQTAKTSPNKRALNFHTNGGWNGHFYSLDLNAHEGPFVSAVNLFLPVLLVLLAYSLCIQLPFQSQRNCGISGLTPQNL